MNKNANTDKLKTSSTGTKKQNVIIFKPDEIAKFGLFGDSLAELAGTSGTKTESTNVSGETLKTVPTTSRHDASITPKMKLKAQSPKKRPTPKSIEISTVSDDKTESESRDSQSGIDVKRKIGDILKKTFEEMKKLEPDKFQAKGTSSVSGTKISLDCNTKSEIVSLLKLAKDKKEAGIETETVEKGRFDSSKKVNVIGITSVKYSDEEIQNILKGSGNVCTASSSELTYNKNVQYDGLTANKVNKNVASVQEIIQNDDISKNEDQQLPQIKTKEFTSKSGDTSESNTHVIDNSPVQMKTQLLNKESTPFAQKTFITESSKRDSNAEAEGNKYKHDNADETFDLEEKIIPSFTAKSKKNVQGASREHLESRASKNSSNIDDFASATEIPQEVSDARKSPKNSESVTSKTEEEKVSQVQTELNIDSGTGFDYYIIQFPPSDENKSKCDNESSTDETKPDAIEQEPVVRPTEETKHRQIELNESETQNPISKSIETRQPAKAMEDIDIEDELSYSVLTMDQSEQQDQPKDEESSKRELASQEPRDTEVSTSEKSVKVINVEKHPEPVGDESIFKVNVVLEGSKPEVVDSVSWHPRKRKQQMDCKVDEEEPAEKRSKPRGRKKKIKDDDLIVDSSMFENVRQHGKKSRVENQKYVEDAGGKSSVIELKDLVAVKHEDFEDEETAKEVLPVDFQQSPIGETKPPKKRGRPRRTKQPYMEEDIPATVFCPLEASKSGRKRRKINYFNLENSLYDELDEKSMGSGKKKGRPKKVKVEDDVLQSTTDESFAESSADFSLAETLIHSETFVNHNPGVQASEFINEPETSEEGLMSLDKARKYRRTGKTAEMLNSVFTAAMLTLNETQLDKSVDGDGEKESPVNTAKKINLKAKRAGRWGWRRKVETFEFNEKNEVTCVVCKAKVPNEEWDNHNSTVHYDLSWRSGENILLDIDLDSFVRKKVEPYLRRLKRLNCDKCQAEFNVSSEFIKHREECFGILVNNMVICAVCKEEMTRDKFYGHRQKAHNALAWRVGDIPLDLTNQHFVMSVLNARYKTKTPLYCYKCDTRKKSVIGYLSHQSQCGLNENDAKISCPECGRKVLPVSLPVHIKMVHETPKTNKVTTDYPVLDDKRRAAKNAMSIITSFSKGNLIGDTSKYYVENPEFTEDFVKYYLQKEANTNKLIMCKFKGCKFTTLDVNIMVSHLISCDSKPLKHFTCRKCLDSYASLDELFVHVKDVHNKNADDEAVQFSDDGSDEDGVDKEYMMRRAVMQKTKKAEVNSPHKVKPLCIAKIPRPGRSLLFTSAFEYNLEFCNNYFSQSELFNHLHCTKENWKLVDENLIQTYLPQSEISCEVGIKQVHGFEEVNQCFFNRFELFEVKIQENHVTMYCGGPINALCWLPTPYLRLDCRQVLAVAVANDFDTKYYMKANYAEPTAIQLWDFGNLKNKHSITMPRLMYCISLNIGPVWHMEWCPSGCFDETSSANDGTFNRLGLLAVAGSIPEVHIYAIPKISEEDWGLVYRTKPVLKLQLSNTQDCGRGSYYPTKISWCKASRHSIVAVGYTNGMVAMFNLDCDSSLLKFKDEDEVDVLLPYKSIQAHTFSISILHILHHANGDRWLLTGGMDKSYIWDLKNDTFINISPKKFILDGIWLTHWLSSITTHDEINLVKGGTGAAQLNCLRKYLSDTGSVVASQTSVSSISSSDWLNAIITGNLSGEILAYFPQQMLFNAQEDKCRVKYKKTLGYAKLIKKGITEKKTEEESEKPDMMEYKKAVAKYGVVFCDFKMDKPEDLPSDHGQKSSSSDKYEEKPRPNLYPLQTMNKISFNPNCQASLYYATGYQIGFVRVSYLKFLDSDKQVV